MAQLAVDLNRQDGFPVWHVQVESTPVNWMTPDVIGMFFMLHHLDDPLSFVKTVRDLWPNVPLAIAQYGPSNLSEDRSSPPRTFIRWNSQSLATALRLARYQPTVYGILSTGAERSSLRFITKALAQTMQLPRVYRFGKKLEPYVLAQLPKAAKQGACVTLAFADPGVQSAPGNQFCVKL